MAALGAALLTGPLHAARIASDDRGLGLIFPWGVLARPAAGGLLLVRGADASLGGTVLAWALAAPLTVWLAHVSNSAARAAEHPRKPPPPPLARAAHAAALLPLAALWGRMALRVGSTYGAAALLLSPPVGWLPIFAYWWLQASLGQT